MRKLCGALVLALLSGACTMSKPDPIVVGAVYPLSGPQGSGGVDELRGVRLALDMVNAEGGVRGRPLELRAIDVPGSDAVATAIDELHAAGVPYVVGSYGSTISAPAADLAARDGMVFWETGAVGDMTSDAGGRLVFRMPPTGAVLGRSAIDFVAHELAARLGRDARSLRFAVVNVHDAYGDSVARGALDELHRLRLPFAGDITYPSHGFDMPAIVHRIAAAKPDVLFVSAYMTDGVALRRQLVLQHVPLVANIGTSSSFCMPEFGARLTKLAVGVFASDKPSASSLNPDGLLPDGRDLLQRANDLYTRRFGGSMSAAALAGFSGGWALFHDVMSQAQVLTADGVAAAARTLRMPAGSLPNGSGIDFAPPSSPDAGANVGAASVIWEWIRPGYAAVVWPPAYATHAIAPMPIDG